MTDDAFDRTMRHHDVRELACKRIALFVAAIWLAFQDEAKREQQPLISPETQAAREALHRAAWGGGEQ